MRVYTYFVYRSNCSIKQIWSTNASFLLRHTQTHAHHIVIHEVNDTNEFIRLISQYIEQITFFKAIEIIVNYTKA